MGGPLAFERNPIYAVDSSPASARPPSAQTDHSLDAAETTASCASSAASSKQFRDQPTTLAGVVRTHTPECVQAAARADLQGGWLGCQCLSAVRLLPSIV